MARQGVNKGGLGEGAIALPDFVRIKGCYTTKTLTQTAGL
jgi:hypothetical protein